MKQKYMFLEDEGDRWFERNRDKLGMYDIETDPVVAAIRMLKIEPKRVLEVGCGSGNRLVSLRAMYKCEIMGVEPSLKAAVAAAALRVPVMQSTASLLPVAGPFDLVIYGFCLYLTDPEDWLTIASEGDRVLADDGHLIIHDFFWDGPANARRYEHRDGVLSYHTDFARLWLGHPLYSVVTRQCIDADVVVTVLKKRSARTIPVLP